MKLPELEYLRELVAIPSVSGEETEIAGFVAHECRRLGHYVLRLENNVAVHIPGEDSSRAFLMNGHLDTVPPSDEWATDPFTLQQDPVRKNIYKGLGVVDMLAGDALMLGVAERYEKVRPPCDTLLLFTDREEVEGSGAERTAEWFKTNFAERYHAIGGIILEPTDAAFVGRAIQGDTNWKVEAQGPGGHGSRKFADGSPALERVNDLGYAMRAQRDEWVAKYTDPLLGEPVVNFTSMHGGGVSNVVPTGATANFNIRVTPAMVADLAPVRAKLESDYGVLIKQSWEPRPTVCSSDALIFKAAKAALGHMPFEVYPGATDQCFFQAEDIPMLMYGPGGVKYMHRANEELDIEEVITCRDSILRLMSVFAEYNLAA